MTTIERERPTGDMRPRVAAHVEGGELLGVVGLLDGRTARFLPTSPLAPAVAAILDGAVTIAEVADDVADVFDVPREVAQGDLVALVDQLSTYRLLDDGESADGAIVSPRTLAAPPDN